MGSVGSDILESIVKEAIVGKIRSSPKAIHKCCCYFALLQYYSPCALFILTKVLF